MAETTADTYHRHGDPDPAKWEEQPAVTGRPNDLRDGEVTNTTFADRAKTDGENKAVQSAEGKSLADMTKGELLEEAERRGVDVKRSATKAELVAALGG